MQIAKRMHKVSQEKVSLSSRYPAEGFQSQNTGIRENLDMGRMYIEETINYSTPA